MLYTFPTCDAICQLALNKAGKNIMFEFYTKWILLKGLMWEMAWDVLHLWCVYASQEMLGGEERSWKTSWGYWDSQSKRWWWFGAGWSQWRWMMRAQGSFRMLGCSMLWRGTQRVYLPCKLGEEVEKLWAWMSLRGSLQGRACPGFYFSLAKFRMSAGNASGKVRKAAGWWSLLVGGGIS